MAAPAIGDVTILSKKGSLSRCDIISFIRAAELLEKSFQQAFGCRHPSTGIGSLCNIFTV